MKSANQALIDLLASSDKFLMADLFTFTLITGDVYRWTNADIDIAYNGSIYKAGGSLIKRGKIKNTVGIEVDTLGVTLYPSVADAIGSIRLSTAILSLGFLDNAKLELRRCFLSAWSDPPVGDLILFMGTVSDIKGSGTQIEISVKSKLEVLNAQVPRNLYQASCLNSVYDALCQVDKTSMSVGSQVVSGTTSSIASTLTNLDDYFKLGVLRFTSGANIGVTRTVKKFSNKGFSFSLPLPNLPAPGDYFVVYPGCDGTMDSCKNKFNNLIRFRGMPFIPVPETSI